MKKLRSIFGFKVKSQLSAWTTYAAKCAEGFGRKVLQLSAQIETALFCKLLNITQFCGRSPYTRGEPRISCVVVVLVILFCYVLCI